MTRMPLVLYVVLAVLPIVSAQPPVTLVNNVSLLFPASGQLIPGAVSVPIEQVTLPPTYGSTGLVSGVQPNKPWQVFYRSSPTAVSYTYQNGAAQWLPPRTVPFPVQAPLHLGHLRCCKPMAVLRYNGAQLVRIVQLILAVRAAIQSVGLLRCGGVQPRKPTSTLPRCAVTCRQG